MKPALVDLTPAQADAFGQRPLVGRHWLAGGEMFCDAALIELLDRFPRDRLYAFTMGDDPTRVEQNRLVHHQDASGAELLQAVRCGRLWLNITRIDRADGAYRDLITWLYAELRARVPGFVPLASQGTLLISSPRAQVYYHADGPASVLWHLRGEKRIWVYPALDPHYMRRDLLEDIFAGVRHEYLPYERSYDDGAQVIDLVPGQWVHWPQNAPHRVVNGDSVNVSLSTEHFTAAGQRRYQLYLANRYLRLHWGRQNLSVREDGAMAWSKTALQRGARRLGLNRVAFQQHRPATQRIAADAADGLADLNAGGAG